MNNAGKHGCISASKVDNNFNMISSSLYDRRIDLTSQKDKECNELFK